MIKFDLEKALAGEKVIIRSKAEVEQLKTFEVEGRKIICGVIGETFHYDIQKSDLFMAPKKLSGFVNLYDNGDVGPIIHNSKKEAMCGRNLIKNRIACIDLSQFEEGHGL
jgi:hypothetical protein